MPSFIGNEVALSQVGICASSKIQWSQDKPAGTVIRVWTQVNGVTWEQATNGGSIPGIVPGADVSGKKLRIKVELFGTAKVTPKIWDIKAEVISAGEKFRVLAVTPAPRGAVRVIFGECYALSTATGTVESTGGVIFQRYDSRWDPNAPDASETPPDVTSLAIAVRTAAAGSEVAYLLDVTWVRPNSSFIRGYRVTMTVDGQTTLVGDFGRTANGCTVSAVAADKAHYITVYTISTTHKSSAGAILAVTPNSSTVGIFISVCQLYGFKAPVQFYTTGETKTLWSASGLDLQWIISGNSALVSRVEVYLDNIYVGDVLSGTIAYLRDARAWSLDPNMSDPYFDDAPNFFCGLVAGQTVKVRAVRTDGQYVEDSTVISSGVLLANTFANTGYKQLASFGEGYLLPASTAAPTAGDVPICGPPASYSPWKYGKKVVAGSADKELAMISTDVTLGPQALSTGIGISRGKVPRSGAIDWITFTLDFGTATWDAGASTEVVTPVVYQADANYLVLITPHSLCEFAVTSKTSSNFTVTRNGTTGSVTFDWILIRGTA